MLGSSRSIRWRSSGSTACARNRSTSSTPGWSVTAARSTNDSIASTTSFASKKQRERKTMATASSTTTKVTLPSDKEILITREFDAPRDVVFKAMTDPNLIPRWWGRRGYTTIVEKMDVRPGGKYRFLHRTTDGEESAFRGEYREVVAPERIVQTFEWEPMAGHISVETATFTEQDGRTLLTTRSVFASKEDRDGMIQSGMEKGLRETHDRFAELLVDLRTQDRKQPRERL